MSRAEICWISGPLLRATTSDSFALYDAVRVGAQAVLGEVIRIEGHEITAQVYEDTTGLAPGDPVEGDGLPLSVPLGPGLLGGIFDGLLRPLSGLEGPYVPRGVRTGRPGVFAFTPEVAPGEIVTAGHCLGILRRDEARDQRCCLPPELMGEVISVADPGEYREDEVLCRVRDGNGVEQPVSMRHRWPVRTPRPASARLPASEPLITGQRVLDSLFPIALGGRSAIPGGFGTGKTILLESLAKWCSADIIVYVGCGERGNELTGILEEFPALEDPGTGRRLMERTVIIANTSNMPVAAREASIYSAMTVAEYFRDQGLDVALMADSTSRWAEALRELSGRLGELPGEGGYPAYLSSRLAEFYERAGKVRTLSGDTGSVTIMSTVSPPSGDFSEPVVTHTKRYVRSFWALDTKRAQARIYPAINPLQSYSEEADILADWWLSQGNTQWPELRRAILALLEQQVKLERMARIIGKDSLAHAQQISLLCAELLTDAFLRQSAFSETDRYTSPQRQTRMLRLLGRFNELAQEAVAHGIPPNRIIQLEPFRRVQRMGEEIAEGEWDRFDALSHELEHAFRGLLRGKQEAVRNAG